MGRVSLRRLMVKSVLGNILRVRALKNRGNKALESALTSAEVDLYNRRGLMLPSGLMERFCMGWGLLKRPAQKAVKIIGMYSCGYATTQCMAVGTGDSYREF